jgi:glycosyltransferase involved in cell wall biosynthesis
MGGQKGIACFYSAFSNLLPVTIVSTNNNGTPEHLNAEFLPIITDKKIRYCNPILFYTIKKIINKNKSTHLIIEHPYMGWLGLLLKWFCKVKLVVHSHNIESLRFKSTGKWWWRVLWFYEKVTHRNAEINFFITEEDKEYAIQHFGIKTEKCFTITYGFDFKMPPTSVEKENSKIKLQTIHQIPSDYKILLFNGTLDYKPNLDAVNFIIDKINPILNKNTDFKYKIIICGKGLPESFKNLDHQKNIIYAGFVDDISLYFKGADIFINPVIDGGGIKTKLVEALGNDLYSVSTVEGAFGIPKHTTNNRLKIVDTNNWELFAENIMNADFEKSHINGNFFDYFYWGKIAEKAKNAIESL